MLDLTREWQILVGGTDVSAAVVGWELSREQPDIDTPAWWRGRLTLVGPGLDPLTNSRWRPGSPVQIRVDGTLVFTGKVAMAYYDDWDPVPRLELEVGDVLSLARRQVVPLQEHTPQTLLGLVGATGDIPGTLRVEVSTDMDSPVRLAQQLAWVGSLVGSGLPLTLYTRPDGTVAAVTPAAAPTLEREVGQVVSAKRPRPGLEIPGKVVATASVKVVRQEETSQEQRDTILVSQVGAAVKITIIDGLGRLKEERISSPDGETVSWYTYETNELGPLIPVLTRHPNYRITKTTHVNGELWETEIEEVDVDPTWESLISAGAVQTLRSTFEWFSRESLGFSIPKVQRVKVVKWPGTRLGYRTSAPYLVYLQEEHYFSLRGRSYVSRSVSRARGTIEEGLPPWEGAELVIVSAEIEPDEEYRPPRWLEGSRPQIAVPVSAEVEVVGWDGPPMYVNIPWLTNLTETQAQLTLQGAARWLATEVAGRAYARQVVMPVPSEWLANPRPWHMLRLGQESMWLVGERLVGDQAGVRFEALGVLASPPGTIPAGDGIPGLPSLLTFLVQGSPTVGVGVIARPVVPAGALLASMGVSVVAEFTRITLSPPTGVGVLGVPPGLVGVGLGVEGGYQVDEGGATQNYRVLQAEEYTTVAGIVGIVNFNSDASACGAVILGPSGYVEWVLAPPYTASTDVWLRIRYQSSAAINVTVEVDGSSYEEALPTSFSYGTYDVWLGPLAEISTLRITVYGELTLDAVMLVDQETIDGSGWPEFPPCLE